IPPFGLAENVCGMATMPAVSLRRFAIIVIPEASRPSASLTDRPYRPARAEYAPSHRDVAHDHDNDADAADEVPRPHGPGHDLRCYAPHRHELQLSIPLPASVSSPLSAHFPHPSRCHGFRPASI